jgi:hypothetical protein
MGAHLIDGEFQSDKYPTCPRGKVPLSVKDTTAQDLLWEYAQRRRAVDAEFSADLETALRSAGFQPKELHVYSSENEWVIAYSAEDALEVFQEECDFDAAADYDFTQWPDDKPLTITDEESGPETKLPHEWIADLAAASAGEGARGHWFSGDC